MIGHEVGRELVELRHVGADEQRRGLHRPERDVRDLLVGREARVVNVRPPAHLADHQHVGIGPVPGPRPLLAPGLAEADRRHVGPDVRQVAGRAPEVAADIRAPFPHVAHAVLAQAVDNVAIHLVQGLAHDEIGLLQLGEAVVLRNSGVRAPVVLQQIDAPFGPGARVDLLVLIAACQPLARSRSRRGVDADLQALAVDVVGEGLHVGELLVRLQHAVRVALPFPAVVDVDELVAVRREAARDHGIRGGPHLRVVDRSAPDVPGVPAERRRQAPARHCPRRWSACASPCPLAR